jgi:hypothetical protein
MKFALVMYICSVVAGQCGDGIKDPVVYPTHKDCAIAGYTKSLEVITDMDDKQMSIKISCSFPLLVHRQITANNI